MKRNLFAFLFLMIASTCFAADGSIVYRQPTTDTKWDGGSTGLNAATGRTSLGLGTAAQSATGDFLAAGGTAVNSSAVEGTDLGTLTDTRVCTYDLAGTEIDCNTIMTVDTNTTYTAAANKGLLLTGTAFGLIETCNSGELLKWNGSAWACSNDQSAASGLATTDIDTSIEIRNIVGDEVGTGYLVFNNAPNFTGNIGIGTTIPLSALSIGVGASNAMPITGGDLFVKGNIEFDGKIYGDASALTSFPTFNQNTTGTAAGLTAQYIDWNSSSGGNSIANKPTISGSNTGDSAANSTYSGLDFLVGTATAALSGEIAVGTAPGGELGGTWASPTIDDGITVANMVLTTPNIGVSTATSINKVTITAPASSATLTIADGKTLTATNTVNLNTMTNARLCQYKTTGTVIDCDVDPATYQPALSSASNIGIGTGTVAANLIVSGNLGIGTTVPSARLNVIGVNTTSASMAVNVRNSAMTTMFTILDNGNVGVGTIAPSGLFEVKTASGTNYFSTNVGIGSASPVASLDIVGTIRVDGNVGITTTTCTSFKRGLCVQ